MSKKHVCGFNLLVAAAVAAALPQLVLAQAAPADGEQLKEIEEVVVYGIRYRNHTDDTAPTLSYDLEYFQKFEPNTVGDMLKRVPGAGFVGSDVMEYDGVQLRGLGGGYTQVLINGKKVPGAGDDRSFWVDRIPAEMVERVEILRSNSASRSGDAIAGAINIVLKDSYTFDGTYVRAGLNRWYDGEVNPTLGVVTSGDFAGGRILFGANMQDRYRRKDKRSDRFEDNTLEDLVSWEDQTEIKDGRDWSGNIDYTVDIGETGRLGLSGFFVKTDRDVSEVSFEEELDDEDTIDAFVPGLDPYDQKNYGVGLDYQVGLFGGTTKFSADYARFDNDESEMEASHEYVSDAANFDQDWSADGAEWDASEAEKSAIKAKDTEIGFKLAHTQPLGESTEVEFGADYRHKKRDTGFVNSVWESEDEITYAAAQELDIRTLPYELDGTIDSRIKEKRLDPYVQFSGKSGAFGWEAGLRYETTRADITYLALDDEGEVDAEGEGSRKYNELLPSAHLKWDLTAADRINLSVARSVKRPNFNELIPALLDGEYGDNDYIGNPDLKQETAIGFDVGYERRLGSEGVVGFNVFYRKVKDLNELVNTGDFSEAYRDDLEDEFGIEDVDNAADLAAYLATNPGVTLADIEDEIGYSYVYTSGNVGDGKVYGFEFDLSAPLTVVGLPDTGVFANYSYVKSEVDDFLGERRFNDQAKYVYNLGFIHSIPSWGASFGATFRKQGDAHARLLGEEAIVRYGEELDVFVEKTFGEKLSVRLSANNLLDAKKDEFFDKFDNQADQEGRDYDEYELESEQAGPAVQLVVRWAF
jgi:outer membrane receptor protein involved in Fe transport